jgi:hypothetical protein
VSIIACVIVEVSNALHQESPKNVFWHEKIFTSERDAFARSLSLTTAKLAGPLMIQLAVFLLSAPSEFVTATNPRRRKKVRLNSGIRWFCVILFVSNSDCEVTKLKQIKKMPWCLK